MYQFFIVHGRVIDVDIIMWLSILWQWFQIIQVQVCKSDIQDNEEIIEDLGDSEDLFFSN